MTRQRGLRQLLKTLLLESKREVAPVSPPTPQVAAPERVAEPLEETPGEAEVGIPDEDGESYLERLRAKMERTAMDFARGFINRGQFEKLYAHYQRERARIERLLEIYPEGEEWRAAVTEGQSVAIRRHYQAKVIAYSIYDNDTSLPFYTFGDFKMESELVVGMLSSFRSASIEILGSGLRKTEVEDGKALYFVSGRYTTLVALYSSDPSPIQLRALEDVHRDFETANEESLERGGAQAWQLVFPHRPVLE